MFNFIKHELRAFLNLLGELVSGYISYYITSLISVLCISAVLIPIACLVGALPKWLLWTEAAILFAIFMTKRYKAYAKKEAEKTETEEE